MNKLTIERKRCLDIIEGEIFSKPCRIPSLQITIIRRASTAFHKRLYLILPEVFVSYGDTGSCFTMLKPKHGPVYKGFNQLKMFNHYKNTSHILV